MGEQYWRRTVVASLFAGLALGLAAHARADEWAPAARTQSGDLYEVDVSALTRTGTVVQSWARETLAHPQRDTASGKSFVLELDQRYDDCQGHRFRFGQVTRRGRNGDVVSSGLAPSPWQDIVPESIADGINHVACRASQPPEEKPILDNITVGKWVPLGMSADKKYYFSVLFDRLLKVTDDGVLVVSRSEYVNYEPIDGYPVKYVINANLVDCKQLRTASLAVDSYMGQNARAESLRTAEKDVAFQPIASGSFLANSVTQICASAQPLPKAADETSDDSAAFGTAWGVSKGYLVTASHVVKGAKRIAVYSNGQPVGTAQIAAEDPASDVAVLKFFPLHSGMLQALKLSDHAASLGKSVFTLGYPAPDLLGQRVKMTAGEISATTGPADNARLMQISVPIQPGNSGGPIIGWDGEVVGIADSSLGKIGDEAIAQNVNYAVKASYVRAMLEDLPDLGGYALIKPAPSHEELVLSAQKAVFMLVVTE